MARHPGLPPRRVITLRKQDILQQLVVIDSDPTARARILEMELLFRPMIEQAIKSLPLANSRLERFKTSPYVLLIHSLLSGHSHISQIEGDILPAKLFSSLETSAGKMIEQVTLPIYGWEVVPSQMHTPYSALDGKKTNAGVVTVATLKSGPTCLNDEMAENFADAVVSHAQLWADDGGATQVEFTYGVLYGTYKQSNKKDWHILRNLRDKLGPEVFLESPDGKWGTRFKMGEIEVDATVRIGLDWWDYLGGPHTAIEVWTALIRACVPVGPTGPPSHTYIISDLADIVSGVPSNYAVSLLQGRQLQWLLLIAHHFTDILAP